MTRYTYIFIYLFLIFSGSIIAQRNVDKGDKYFYQNQFEQAIKYYQLDIKTKNKKVAERAMLGLADCYRIIGEFEKAEDMYKKILKKSKKNPLSYLNYGLSLKSSAKYAEAILQFQEYIKMNPSDQMGPVYLQSCDSAQKWLDETIGKEVKNIEQINTNESEFSPYMIDGKIYYSSSRAGSTRALISFDGGGEISRMDIYETQLPALLEKEFAKKNITNVKSINTPAHEGSVTFSADGKEMYFSRTVKGKRDKATNAILSVLQVFCSKKDSAGNWSKPVSAFDFNSSQYSIAHPSLSKDGKTIYFMSDMPGGYGKTDIYSSTRANDTSAWAMPKNLGFRVNTFGYELFPAVVADTILYFSSNAHPGMGQLDIFTAQHIGNSWVNIQNVKPPINSIGNDFGICFDESNSRGFFSSDRFNGKGAEDIYSFAKDLPVLVSLSNDTVSLSNHYIFDEIKYKLTKVNDSVDVDFSTTEATVSFVVEANKSFVLTLKKNGMPINKIDFLRETDSISKKILSYTIKTSAIPVKLIGKLPLIQGTEWSDMKWELMLNGEVVELVNLNNEGVFELKKELEVEAEYKLVPKHKVN